MVVKLRTVLAPAMGTSQEAVMAPAIADGSKLGYGKLYRLILDHVRSKMTYEPSALPMNITFACNRHRQCVLCVYFWAAWSAVALLSPPYCSYGALGRVKPMQAACCAEPEGDCKSAACAKPGGEPACAGPLHAWQGQNRHGRHACSAPV